MTYRKCRNPHPLPEGQEPVTEQEMIELAIDAFGWPRKKVLSWYQKENPRLKKARPSELVDRGQAEIVKEFLKLKKAERITNQNRVKKLLK